MSEKGCTNTLLEVTSQRSHATKNRNGDIYLFGKGMKEYIGSSSLLSNLKFTVIGDVVPEEIREKKYIAEIISDEQFDDLDAYIPYSKDGKLMIPIPLSEKHARSWKYRYFDCTVSGSTVWPAVLELENGILRIITILCDNEGLDKTYEIYSHWTYVNKDITPACVQF